MPHPDLARGGTHLCPGWGVSLPGWGRGGGLPHACPWDIPSLPGQGAPHPSTGWGGHHSDLAEIPPPQRTWDQWKYYGMEMEYPLPPGKDMVPVEVLWDGDGVPPVNRQTPVKT